MPGYNGTGPRGEGPMTGGGFGSCAPGGIGYGRSFGRGFGPGRGRGYGPGIGRGRGYGRGLGRPSAQPYADAGYGQAYGRPYAMNPKDEAEMLKEEVIFLKNELDAITGRIKELESGASEPES
ncbi:DUF5320 domain-containing protein [Thermodesulfobacteriota bacterium]